MKSTDTADAERVIDEWRATMQAIAETLQKLREAADREREQAIVDALPRAHRVPT